MAGRRRPPQGAGSGADSPVSARDWLGEDAFPWPAIAGMDEGDPIAACYCVVAVTSALTKYNKPYLKLQLADRHGGVEARVWEDAERIEAMTVAGAFVGVRGRVEIFNGGRQIRVESIAPLEVGIDELDLFMARSPRDLTVMARELDETIWGVEDRPLRSLLLALLGADTETGRAFRRAPAAKLNHHAYVGGLLEHTLSVTGLAIRMAEHYGPEIDRDLLVTGALLHDIGKIHEIGLSAGFPYTGRGKLLGHILMGLDDVAAAGRDVEGLDPDRLDLVLHLVASHQGRYEWQSPREPRTLEAIILHHCDDTDAKMQMALELTRATDEGWTDYSRNLGGEILRHRSEFEVESAREALAERSAPGLSGARAQDSVDGAAGGRAREAEGQADSAVEGPAVSGGRQEGRRNGGKGRSGGADAQGGKPGAPEQEDPAHYDLFEQG